MRFLIFHGYLLRGTGSNVYNASLCRALAGLGHEVHLLCQDHRAGELPFVDAVGEWGEGGLAVRTAREPARVTAYLPPIGRLLPVYVADEYEHFEARPLPELSDAEIGAYLDANVAAVREVAERAGAEAALANHLVMGPAILARALGGRVPYAVKVHGSALEYTVKREPGRFLPYAREGLAPARAVLCGSRHTAESLWAAVGDPAVEAKTRLGPPGVDVDAFRPRPPGEAAAGLRALAERLEARGPADWGGEAGAAAALRALDPEREPIVAYVGKLIAAKGVDLLLAAWPLVVERVPEARLVVVGFGTHREALGRVRDALPADAAARVHFTGRLEHADVGALLAACEAIAVPSTFPEAFGMVAAEGAACGALPVSAAHSGLAEVTAALAPALEEPLRGLLSFELGEGAVRDLAARLGEWLALEPARRESASAALATAARERFGWEGVARRVVAAAEGRLGELPTP